MNPEEYEILARVEREHWFYRGKRALIKIWIDRLYAKKKPSLLVDCGCGTGFFAKSLLDQGYPVLGVDDHEDSVVKAKALLGAVNFRQGSAENFPFPENSVDSITMLDVLEHLKSDQKALQSIALALKPEGTLILTVPAFQFLWSDWDHALHHYRRYSPATLLPLFEKAGLQIEFWNFINVIAFPIVCLVRFWRVVRDEEIDPMKRPENKIPPLWLNLILEKTFVWLATQKWIRFPFGVSLLVIARKSK